MPELPFEIVRSARRKKTVQAKLVNGTVRVMVPADVTDAEAERWARELVERIQRKRATGEIDLTERARLLAREHDLPEPDSISWSERQNQRWGSCTRDSSSIRISSRLTGMPDWVLDYVIVHELAHIDIPNHGPEFDRLVSRYPLAERARGYLLAKSEE